MKVSKSRLLAIALILAISVSMFSMFSLPAEQAFVNVEDYAYLEGVLDTDSYALYPYENKSLDIGFSKYGEMISKDALGEGDSVGLMYDDGPDPFGNENVSITEWSEGWLMNITYEYAGDSWNVWAFALFSDFSKIEGNWINNASRPADDRPGFKGGRKCSGYAETDDMEVLYDGPRRCIVLLTTRIYDPRVPNPQDPEDERGLPLVALYIQVVFNKVKKYVTLIKDIKLLVRSKLFEKMQVKFSQRGEWDLGWGVPPLSYAHFYHALPTKYFKHPWYYADRWYTGYDLCQMIDEDENYVAYAAYWPELMSWRVEGIQRLDRKSELLTDLSDWEHHWTGAEYSEIEGEFDDNDYEYSTSLPGYYQGLEHYDNYEDDEYGLYYPNCEFPPTWSYAEPEVYIQGAKQTEGIDYYWSWDDGTPGGWGEREPGERVNEVSGDFTLVLDSKPADVADIYVHWKLHAEQDDMTQEPRTPYTIGEWVFDLTLDDEALPTDQFRCVTVFGITDLNDGEDCDIDEGYGNIIDSEVMYQLNEVFNPWDLKQAVGAWSWADYEGIYVADLTGWEYKDGWRDRAWGDTDVREEWPGKWTERWVQFETGDGVEEEFWLEQQIVVPDGWEPYWEGWEPFPGWDEYCSAREKVLVDGVLQVPGDDYEIAWTWNITETVAEGPLDIDEGDSFQLMYPRIVVGSENVTIEWDDGTTDILTLDVDYSLDTSNGKLYIWDDIELEEDDALMIDYALYFPATYIDFYEDSAPDEDAHIKILYSAFRLVYKVDKFIYGQDGWWEENSEIEDFYYPEEWDAFMLRYGPVCWLDFANFTHDNWITVLLNGTELDDDSWDWDWEDQMYWGVDVIYNEGREMQYNDVIEVIYPIFAGRYEWTTVGAKSAAVDSAGSSMVTEGFRQWKNHDTKIAGLDFQDTAFGPNNPYIFRNVSGTGDDREDYYDDQLPQIYETGNGRAHLKDDWCTTLPIASSNIIVVGGPIANLAAEYFNDFTDIYAPRLGSTWTAGLSSSACWNRNQYEPEYEEGEQVTGYAVVSTYKDLNGTIGFIVYGVTGDDTYYATYALQHGLLEIMQWLQPGVTSLLLEFDYTKHPSDDCFFHIVEALGTFTECSGFEDSIFYLWSDAYEDEMIFKLVWNSYSSEYWVFHVHVDFDVKKPWHYGDLFAIEVTYPQYIYFHWEPKIHPDP